MQEKRRDLYLEYAKGLKAKAKITVDDKALEQAATALAQHKDKDLDLSNMTAHPAGRSKKTPRRNGVPMKTTRLTHLLAPALLLGLVFFSCKKKAEEKARGPAGPGPRPMSGSWPR